MAASILTIVFEKQYVQTHDIPQWRRVVNDVVGWQEPLLHNHTPERGEYHHYPLVQYRAIDGFGALVAIGEGANVLLRILPLLQAELGKAHLDLDQAHVVETAHVQYSLYRWLALNPVNYKEWQQTRSLIEHLQLLERVLTGQLNGLLKTLEIAPLPVVNVCIEHLDELGHFSIPTDKGEVQHLAFNVKFNTTVRLPLNQLGIGKFSSKGYGILNGLPTSKRLNNELTQRNKKNQEARRSF